MSIQESISVSLLTMVQLNALAGVATKSLWQNRTTYQIVPTLDYGKEASESLNKTISSGKLREKKIESNISKYF